MKENQEPISVLAPQVTKEQFLEYVEVQEGGMFNMLDPRARQMTNLSSAEWSYIIRNYSHIKAYYCI